ncbi:hypothetical protein CVT24_007611 [Panaeolus cyanescens]|uniref:F-box domain-containing protein n=1 Tax=Panaeolus cyanescens TaxID=181874 RepID=A0A409YKL5_9AGAR|nr:hypothetical protein CVT24_007611 [Panaeolus cyanescens]
MHSFLSKLSSLLSHKKKKKVAPSQLSPEPTCTSSSTTIEHLPNEILEKIFSFCSTSDLFHLSHTSRHLSHSAIRVLYHNIPRMDADRTIDMLLTLCAYATSRNHIIGANRVEHTNATDPNFYGGDIPSYIHSLSLVFTDHQMCQPLSKGHSSRLAQLNKIHRDRQLRHAKSIPLSIPTSGKSGTVSSGSYRPATLPKSLTLSLIPAALTTSFAAMTTSYISIVAAALSILPNLDHLELKLQFPEGSDRHLGKLLSMSPLPGGESNIALFSAPSIPFQLTSFSTTIEFGPCMALFLQSQSKLKELTVMHVRKSSQAFWKEDMLHKRVENVDPTASKALPALTSLSYSDRTPLELVQYLAKGRAIDKLKVSWTDVSAPNNHISPPPPHPQSHSPQIAQAVPAYVNNVASAVHLPAAGMVNPNSIVRLLSVTDDPRKVKHVQCAFQRSHGGSVRGFNAPAFTSNLLVGSAQMSAIAGTLPSIRTLVVRIESLDEAFLHDLYTSLPLFHQLQKLSVVGSNACSSPKLTAIHNAHTSSADMSDAQADHWDWDGWGLPKPLGTRNLVELDLTHCSGAGPVKPFISLVNEYLSQCPSLKCLIIPALPLPSGDAIGRADFASNSRSTLNKNIRKVSRSNESISALSDSGGPQKNASALLNASGAGYWVFRRKLTVSEETKLEVPQRSKLKKDPGIPKLPDLKARVRNAQKKPSVPPERRMDPDATMAAEPTLSTLAMMASEAEALHNEFSDPSSSTSGGMKTKEQLRKYYLKALHKVVDESDIVILVLDARDPEGCRSRLVEEEVRRRESEGKKLVFVLNKIDLIPKSNAQAWLKYLRHSTPTLPFLSSASSHQRSNISSSTAPALIKLLKAYKPKAGSVTIGVVGYPNVGKSSLINCLKRSKVCAVAAQAGHTKDLQSIQLERGMRIIDSPGVVFDDDQYDDGKGNKKGSVLLRNVVKVEDIDDPIAVVEEIMTRTPHETLQKIYNIPQFSSTIEFLTMLAMVTGKLLKGGTPDLNASARSVLMDWNQQKIPYFSEPPSIHPSLIPSTVAATRDGPDGPMVAPGAENVGQAQIVTEFAKPFELEGLFGAADAGAFGGRHGDGDTPMADEEGDVFWDAVEGEDLMETEQNDSVQMGGSFLDPVIPRKRERSPSEAPVPATVNSMVLDSEASRFTRQPKRQRKNRDTDPMEHSQTTDKSNPLSRKLLKKEAKKARKANRHRGHGSSAGGSGGGMEIDDEGLQFTFMS